MNLCALSSTCDVVSICVFVLSLKPPVIKEITEVKEIEKPKRNQVKCPEPVTPDLHAIIYVFNLRSAEFPGINQHLKGYCV